MRDLQDLEIFEIELLDLLRRIGILDSLHFGGGTMLRLCHNLNRFSTDLDFWLKAGIDAKTIFKRISLPLNEKYSVVDAANKRHTILFEIRSPASHRSLKLEIRKNESRYDTERKIAFSKYTSMQVMVHGLTLRQMMQNKIEALLSRKLIRDCFDIEFLFMRGMELPSDQKILAQMLEIIESFRDLDYRVTLGSILLDADRKVTSLRRFNLLREEITARLR